MQKIPILISAIAFLAVAGIAEAGPPNCRDRSQIVRHLLNKYAERPIASLLDQNGRLLEIMMSKSGRSWTIISTGPDGVSCQIGAGRHWQTFGRNGGMAPVDRSNKTEPMFRNSIPTAPVSRRRLISLRLAHGFEEQKYRETVICFSTEDTTDTPYEVLVGPTWVRSESRSSSPYGRALIEARSISVSRYVAIPSL